MTGQQLPEQSDIAAAVARREFHGYDDQDAPDVGLPFQPGQSKREAYEREDRRT